MTNGKAQYLWSTDGCKIIDSGRGVIAVVPLPQDGGVFDAMENLTLMARAPELLEALKELLETDESWHGSVNSEMATARRKARRAIKAAEKP